MFAPEVLPETRPAVGRVMGDDRRRTWLARFEPFGLTESEWYVLDPRGVPVGRITFRSDEKTVLAEVRGDSLLLIRWDEFDVSRIEIVEVEQSER